MNLRKLIWAIALLPILAMVVPVAFGDGKKGESAAPMAPVAKSDKPVAVPMSVKVFLLKHLESPETVESVLTALLGEQDEFVPDMKAAEQLKNQPAASHGNLGHGGGISGGLNAGGGFGGFGALGGNGLGGGGGALGCGPSANAAAAQLGMP
ncbi:MAG: hypothetical protein ACRCZF_18235, partial [Gemmataceae bacterium]